MSRDQKKDIANVQSGLPVLTEIQAKIDRFFKDLSFLVRAGHTNTVNSIAYSPSGDAVARPGRMTKR